MGSDTERHSKVVVNEENAIKFEKKHAVYAQLSDAFEDSGGSGHDLGLEGVVAIIAKWEAIRNKALVSDLREVVLGSDAASMDETPSCNRLKGSRTEGIPEAPSAPNQREISVDVIVPVKCRVPGVTPERIRAIVEKLVDIGIGDAVATLEDKEGDLADAQLAADLEIFAPTLAPALASVKLSEGIKPSTPGTFLVPVQVAVEADSLEEGTEEVRGFMDYAFEVSNDEGRLRGFKVGSSEPAEFAVIGYYEESGQIFCDHVTASDPYNAIAKSAAEREGDPAFIGALPAQDTARLEYAGESVVFAETVREQTDVFPLDDDSPSFRM